MHSTDVFHLVSDEALFERYRQHGDAGAIARLVDRVAPELLRVAFHLVRDVHDAEDVVQATFLTALESAASFQRGRRFVPWLIGILVHRARTRVRDRRSAAARVAGEVDLRVLVDGRASGPELAASLVELDERLRAALARIDPPYREPLHLALLHALEPAEIAAALGRTPGTVRTQLARGLERLRAALPASFAESARSEVGGVLPSALAAAIERRFEPSGEALSSIHEAVQRACSGPLGFASTSASSAFLAVVPWFAMKLWSFAAVCVLIVVALVAGMRERSPDNTRVVASSPMSDVDASLVASEGLVGARDGGRRTPLSEEWSSSDALDGPATLAVSVVDHEGRPISRATIFARPSASDGFLAERNVRADVDGRARITDLAAGQWTVHELRGGATTVEVAPRGETSVDITLPLGVRVEGLVVDQAEAPVAGASVWLPVGERDVWAWHVLAATGADGRFELEHLAPGTFIGAFTAGLGRSAVAVVQPVATDSTAPWVQSVRLSLGPPACALEGHVRDAEGADCAGALVLVGANTDELEPFGDGQMYFASLCVRTDHRGRFRVDGVYREHGVISVWARAAGHSANCVEVQIPTAGDAAVSVQLMRGFDIEGTVVDAEGQAVKEARVSAFHEELEPRLSSDQTQPAWSRPWAVTDAIGRYELRGVRAGQVRLRATAPFLGREVPLDPARTDDTRIGTFEPGTDVRWDAVLGEAHSIEGVIVDEDGTELADWRVWANGPPGAYSPGMTPTDTRGRFELLGCDDETPYHVFAGPENTHPAAVTRDEVRPDGPPITLVVARAHVPSGFVTGRVVDANGVDIESLYLSLTRSGMGRATSCVSQRVAGSFRVGPIAPGRYEARGGISAGWDSDEGFSLGAFTVESGGTVDLGTKALQAPGSLHLRVLTSSGEALISGRLILTREGERHPSTLLTLSRGQAKAPALQPGRYLVQPCWDLTQGFFVEQVSVNSGEVSEVTFALPTTVRRTLRLPPVGGPNTLIEIEWAPLETSTEPRGRQHRVVTQIDNTEAHMNWPVHLVPGSYRVSIALQGGAAVTLDVVIEARDAPDEIIELPVPEGW